MQRNGPWPHSEENSKKEFARRTDADNSLFLELAQLTGQNRNGYPVIDIRTMKNSAYAKLGRAMHAAIGSAEPRPGTPYHENDPPKLPPFPNQVVYAEYNYFGGGTRLVVDLFRDIVYITPHYRSFYVFEEGGNTIGELVERSRAMYERDVATGLIEYLEDLLRQGQHFY